MKSCCSVGRATIDESLALGSNHCKKFFFRRLFHQRFFFLAGIRTQCRREFLPRLLGSAASTISEVVMEQHDVTKFECSCSSIG